MKISSGGIGTVATSQACNAKSVYPYQWAWNAVGTDLTSATVTLTEASCDFESHPKGIKFTAKTVSPLVFFKYNEELPAENPGGNRSGKLTRADAFAAKYLHLVVDMTGWTDTNTIASNSFLTKNGIGWNNGVIYWYHGTGASSLYRGGVAQHPNQANGTHILVWNLRDQLLFVNSADTTPSIWGTSEMSEDDPIGFRFYTGENFLAAGFEGDASSLVLCGFVISDRILYDIPLPIRTHMG
jgi:hypothetical protein